MVCGLVFDVECRKDGPPLEHLLIQAVKVRGQLGPMAVYVTPESYKEKVASRCNRAALIHAPIEAHANDFAVWITHSYVL
ncbi:hypothetical protein DIPPA_05057 [Diplonema papillatum]|nr:hypothetical protein DIPPA_05057 [Diplonema papillatum]